MTKLNINDFFAYSSTALYEFLFVQAETEYHIIIPREYVAGIDDNFCVATDYVNAAYAGQRLAEIANSFGYYTPGEFCERPFQFRIKVTDLEKFADTLYFIIQGLNFNDTKELFITFHGLAADFLNEAFEDKIKCHTWGLLYLGGEYLDEES